MSRLLIILMIAFLTGCGSSAGRIEPQHTAPLADLDYPVGSFSLTERDGRTVTEKDLAGKVWIASFVFTRCMGNCPAVTASVRELQSKLADQPDVMFVTFTVDAAHDNPGELKKYAERYQADAKRWLFLTGDEKTIRGLLKDRFKQSAGDEPGNGLSELDALQSHSTRLVVVDKHGVIRAMFDGMRNANFPDSEERFAQGMKRIEEKVKQLTMEK
ncbi:MAG TPA: SCO family protein [Urbifossiella sp.]|jgi:cytochrome oxidase Cu insertion factor (SCO1/SenC/PrrC family)